ncbi:hypothetical protein [Halosimplex halobium]|uniref:hypothetical protein n=1 Tax=Halosimplex halobium TaxID=3396618 RepID=UPI003F57E9BF
MSKDVLIGPNSKRSAIVILFGIPLGIAAYASLGVLSPLIAFPGADYQFHVLFAAVIGLVAATATVLNGGVVPGFAVGAAPFFAYRLWWYQVYGCSPCPDTLAGVFPVALEQTLTFSLLPGVVGVAAGLWLRRRRSD